MCKLGVIVSYNKACRVRLIRGMLCLILLVLKADRLSIIDVLCKIGVLISHEILTCKVFILIHLAKWGLYYCLFRTASLSKYERIGTLTIRISIIMGKRVFLNVHVVATSIHSISLHF